MFFSSDSFFLGVKKPSSPFDIKRDPGGNKDIKIILKNIKIQPMRYSEKISLILPFTD